MAHHIAAALLNPLCAALLLAAPDAPPPAAAAPASAPPAVPAPPPLAAPRPVPDYDGRPPAGAGAAEALLFVPRLVLYPAHLVAEYGLRRPVVGLVTLAEKHHVAQRVIGFFTWRDGDAGVFPTVALRSDMKPLVGFSLFFDGAGHEDHDFRLRASGWDRTAVSAAVEDRWRVFEDRSGLLTLAGMFRRTDDNAFYGLGPQTLEAIRFYYLSDTVDVGATVAARLGGLSSATLGLRHREADFEGSDYGGGARDLGPALGAEPAAVAPGFAAGYRLTRLALDLALDSRQPSRRDYPGSGFRLDLDGAVALSPGDTDLAFFTWGAGAAGILDLTGYEHLLVLQVAVAFLEDVGSQPVPFTEQVTLGGPQFMRGFREGRFRGDSAFTAGLHYRYPIWMFADAELSSAVGNVFPDHLDGLEPEALYWSNGISLKSNFSRETAVGFTAAIGSTRFDAADFALADSVRLFFGVGQGF